MMIFVVCCAQRLDMQVSHRGFYSFKIDATSLVDPYDRHVSVMPEVYEVAMNSQISTPLSDTMGATLGGAPINPCL